MSDTLPDANSATADVAVVARNERKTAINKLTQILISGITIVTEIVVILFIGANIGSYLSNRTVIADCQRVNMAKVGDTYVTCTIVEPKKDAPTTVPR